jgi:hypothetical protein
VKSFAPISNAKSNSDLAQSINLNIPLSISSLKPFVLFLNHYIILVSIAELVPSNVFVINYEGGRKSMLFDPTALLLNVVNNFCKTHGMDLNGIDNLFLLFIS